MIISLKIAFQWKILLITKKLLYETDRLKFQGFNSTVPYINSLELVWLTLSLHLFYLFILTVRNVYNHLFLVQKDGKEVGKAYKYL